MINLGHGEIYLNNGDPAPLGCPKCYSSIYDEEEQIIQCPTCYFKGDRIEFTAARWELQLPN